MSTQQVITVTWMDGQTEQYDQVVTYRVADGMLTIVQAVKRDIGDLLDPSAIKQGPPKALHLPLANIRAWKDVVGVPELGDKHWSKVDMQLWIITFGATLAANIATVGFIAAAISLLHWVNKQQPNQQLTEWYWAVALGFMGAILLFCITVSRRVKAGVGPSIYWTWSLRILLAISILFALLFGLVLLGLAAGVK